MTLSVLSDRDRVRERCHGPGLHHRRLQEPGAHQLRAGQGLRQRSGGLPGRVQERDARGPAAVFHQGAHRVHAGPVCQRRGREGGGVPCAVHGPGLHDGHGPAPHVPDQLHRQGGRSAGGPARHHRPHGRTVPGRRGGVGQQGQERRYGS